MAGGVGAPGGGGRAARGLMRVHQLIAAAAPGDAVTGQALAWQGDPARLGRRRRDRRRARPPRARGDGPAPGRARRRPRRRRRPRPALLGVEPGGRGRPGVGRAPRRLLPQRHAGIADPRLQPRPRRRVRPGPRRAAAPARAAPRRSWPTPASTPSSCGEAGVGEARVVPLILDVPPRARPGAPGRLAARRSSRWGGSCRTSASTTSCGPSPSTAATARPAPRSRWSAATAASRATAAALEDLVGADRRRAGCASPAGSRDAERDGVYARADAYLCMSEHEGFCAPLVEALARGVPVVARRAAAVPETLGGAGLLVDEPDLLPLAAEALHEVVSSQETRAGLAAAAARRHAELRPEAIVPGPAQRARPAAGGLMGRAVAGGAGGAALRARGERRRRAARAPGRAAAGGRPRPDRPHHLRPRLPHLGQPLPGRRAGRRGGAGGPLPGGARARRRRLRRPLRRGPTPRPTTPRSRGAGWTPRARTPPGCSAHLRDEGGRYDAVAFVTYLYRTTADGIGLVRDRALLVPTLHDEPPARLAIFRGGVRRRAGPDLL